MFFARLFLCLRLSVVFFAPEDISSNSENLQHTIKDDGIHQRQNVCTLARFVVFFTPHQEDDLQIYLIGIQYVPQELSVKIGIYRYVMWSI